MIQTFVREVGRGSDEQERSLEIVRTRRAAVFWACEEVLWLKPED